MKSADRSRPAALFVLALAAAFALTACSAESGHSEDDGHDHSGHDHAKDAK